VNRPWNRRQRRRKPVFKGVLDFDAKRSNGGHGK
jgi:hypothetical protein